LRNSEIVIAILFHDSDRFYSGGTRSMVDLLNYWKDDQNLSLVAVFPSEGSAVDYVRTLSIPVIVTTYFNNKKSIGIKGIPYFCEMAKYTIKMIINKFNVDNKIIPQLQKYNVDIIYANTSVNFIGIWIKNKIHKPLVWHFRESIEHNQFADMWGGMKRFYKNVNRYTDKVIFNSNALKQVYGENIQKQLIEVVYDDISPLFINPIKTVKDNECINILIAGFVDVPKGQLTVVKAINRVINKGLNQVHLYIAGHGNIEYIKEIKEYVNQEQIQNNVHLLGDVENINELRKKMDIGVVATKFEAFGRVSIEGMLSKMAMIGANCGATPELYKDGQYGLLYTWNDDQELAEKIEFLCKNKLEWINLCEDGFTYGVSFTEGNGALKIKDLLVSLKCNK